MAKVVPYRGHEIHPDSSGRLQAIRHEWVAAAGDTMDEVKRAIDALCKSESEGVKDES